MAYFNDYANYYPISSAREELNTYQLLDQTPATEEANYNEGPYNTSSDYWTMPEQLGSIVGLSTSLPATAGYGEHCYNLFADWCLTLGSPESLAPATSYVNQTDGYGQPLYSSHHWPEVGQQAPSYYSVPLSQDFSSAGTAAPEPFTVVPTFDSGKSVLSPKLRVLEYLPITDSPAQPLGGERERALHQHVLYGKR